MWTTIEGESRIDVIEQRSMPENVDVAGFPPLDASRFVKSVLDRVAEIQDDLAIALLVRARVERTGALIPLEVFLEGEGFDVAQLEAELDAEDQ